MGIFSIRAKGILFFARACASARTETVLFCIVFSAFPAFAQNTDAFLLGKDNRIHGVAVDHSLEKSTRLKMKVLDNCRGVKTQPSALALIGSEGSALMPHIHSKRGLMILEGLKPGSDAKVLDTELLALYKNYPTSIPGETTVAPSPRYPLAITFAATLVGQDDLTIQKGDSLTIKADGQLYAYSLPEITIPSEGVLRVYVGTDDQLYYDSQLTHALHKGTCKKAS